jgi:hypothetical protein
MDDADCTQPTTSSPWGDVDTAVMHVLLTGTYAQLLLLSVRPCASSTFSVGTPTAQNLLDLRLSTSYPPCPRPRPRRARSSQGPGHA